MQNKYSKTMKFPNFFVVGAGKCGTTTLYHILFQHPEIFMSPIKEPNHFCTDIKEEEFSEQFKLIEKRKNINLDEYLNGPMTERKFGYFVPKSEDYKKLFKNVKNEKAIGEISNSYLFSKVAAQNIKDAVPDAKIIIILRNPIDRMVSHYKANIRDGKALKPFYEEVTDDYNKNPKGWCISHSYFEVGQYADQVDRYLKVFGKENVKVLWFEDWKKNSSNMAREIFTFLGVDPNIQIDPEERQHTTTEPRSKKLVYLLSQSGIKKPALRLFPQSWREPIKSIFFNNKASFAITPDERKKLQDFFRADIEKLQSLLNVDLSKWLA